MNESKSGSVYLFLWVASGTENDWGGLFSSSVARCWSNKVDQMLPKVTQIVPKAVIR